MSGTLREKYPGIWQVRFEAGRDPLTGVRRQLSRNVHGSKRTAQQALNALVAEAEAGRSGGTSGTFEQLSTKWLTHVEHDLSPTTLRRYVLMELLQDLTDNGAIQAQPLPQVQQVRRRGLDPNIGESQLRSTGPSRTRALRDRS
jgi:hypothetical protein